MATERSEASDGLLASFPNLQSLPLLGPEEEWYNIKVPLLPAEGVTKGVLKNGLTYFVQENKEPKARAELYLVVGFGSLVEEEEERGIAHIIEHLGFSATKAYENHAIIKFLESIGSPFGACQNAYTSFDRTVYTLHVPTDKEGIVKESLTVLREFAYFTRISEEDLEKERKVVLEEWRESKNAQGRMFEKYIHALAKGCKYPERLPIGKEEVIRGVPAETLRNFYKKYYHPQRMAVVAIGDFEAGTMVKDIEELFDIAPEDISPLPRAPSAPERPWFVVPDSEGVAVASSTDSELSFAQGMVDCKRPRQTFKSLADIRRGFTEDLFHKALSSRLLRITLEPKGTRNFFMVSTDTGDPIPPLSPMSIQIAPLPGRMRPAFREIAREIERVKRLGFYDAEIQRAKRAFLAEFEEQYIERDQQPSTNKAEEYTELFLDGKPAPGVKQNAQLAVTVLPSITCEAVSAIAGQFDFKKNVVVKISTPPFSVWNPLYTCWGIFQALRNRLLPRPKIDLPDSAEVTSDLLGACDEALEPWPPDEDNVDTRLQNRFEACAGRRLALSEDKKASVREVCAMGVPQPSREAPSGDATVPKDHAAPLGDELLLQNGLRIFLKHTDLFDDEVLLRGRRWGGLSGHIQKNMFAKKGGVSTEAQVASMVAMMLGICGLSMESMQECLDGRRMEPNPPSFEAYFTGLDASSSPVDLEGLLTLVHLMFMSPVEPGSKSRGRLTLVKLGLLAMRLAEERDPASRFSKRVTQCISNDHPYHRSPSLWSILRLNFGRAAEIFNERTSNPCEWTFVLCGKIPAKEVLVPLLEKYLGSIPNVARSEHPQAALGTRRDDLEMRQAVPPVIVSFPEKPVREEVRLHMVDPKGSNIISFPISLSNAAQAGDVASVQADLRDIFVLGFLVRMLTTRLIEVLRFKRGQVYGAQVMSDFALTPPHLGEKRRGTLNVSFECDPAEADEVIAATLEEFQKLRDGTAAFTEEQVAATLEQEKREFEELVRKNDFWCNTILDLYFARANVITRDIGETMALWWRVRTEVMESFDATAAGEVFRSLLPEGASSAVISMRPKLGWRASLSNLASRLFGKESFFGRVFSKAGTQTS